MYLQKSASINVTAACGVVACQCLCSTLSFCPQRQQLRMGGDVTKCLLKAGKKETRGGEPGEARYGAPMACEQQSFGQPRKARSLSSQYLASSVGI